MSQVETHFAHLFHEQHEKITFANGISTLKARGQVEKWLNELEKNMKESVSNEIQKTLAARNEHSIVEWIEQWPGQCVMNGNNFSVSVNSLTHLQHLLR